MGNSPTFEKDPNAVLDYVWNWEDWLASGETISTSSMIVDNGITKDSDSKTDTRTKIWLSGGTAGTAYAVTNRIVTSDGRTDDRTIYIKVIER